MFVFIDIGDKRALVKYQTAMTMRVSRIWTNAINRHTRQQDRGAKKKAPAYAGA